MGRRADPKQAAKGNPNRRKSANREREAEALRVAKLLSATPGPITDPPAMLDQGKLYAGAVAVWRDMAPRLARTHRLSDQHKPIFAMFCVYFADWVSLNDLLAKEGPTQTVTTVAGDPMIRSHPAVKLRQQAFENVLKLSAQFGLTPHDEYDLFKNQSMAAAMNPGLFGQLPVQQPKPDVDAAAAEPEGPRAGMLGEMNGKPPGASAH